MELATIQAFLGWSVLLNWAVLIVWGAMFMGAHDAIYRLHTRWFELDRLAFDRIHYVGMAIYKLAIILFCLVPYLSLLILQSR